MSNLSWYFNRLRAMNLPEVGWRLQQKEIQRRERKKFGLQKQSVCSRIFNNDLSGLCFYPHSIGLNFQNASRSSCTDIHLPGGYDYGSHKNRWNAGFQTAGEWEDVFSYALTYKQRDDIGDARTNWELNRHFQFALLAKACYTTGCKGYAEELESLFQDWNGRNPFLHGISWTSTMEVAIRCIQWCIALAFIKEGECGKDGAWQKEMETGILNMADYVAKHYSRFSSANNHLLVEATVLAYAGFAFHYDHWKNLAIGILDRELLNQNYRDGVNKEMSLHYQTFGMEAYALVMHLMEREEMQIPETWKTMLGKQCEFVVHSMVDETTACEFGDNDEGKILDLEGGTTSHYRYVLQLGSLVLHKRFDRFEHPSETVRWLYTEEEIGKCRDLPAFEASESRTFPEGGYSFLRSRNGRIVIGIDHAPLGFGTIAAHGHADALSFQLYVDGKCLLGDPGTFIYHCRSDKRNDYRRSCNHNTIWLEHEEQSQMMGAFLWGKKARTELIHSEQDADKNELTAKCVWWNGNIHTRNFIFDRNRHIVIDDCFEADRNGWATLMLHPDCEVAISDRIVTVTREHIVLRIETDTRPELLESWYSTEYGTETTCRKITYRLNENKQTMKIWIEKY